MPVHSLPGFVCFVLLAGAAHGEVHPRLAECRALADASERVVCYDVAVDALTPTPSAHLPTQMPPEAMFGLEGAAAAEAAGRVLGLQNPQNIRARVRVVQSTAEGKLVLELHNGQVWVQTDAARLAVNPEDEVIIRRARLGSFLLKKPGSNRSIRVRRVD